MPYAKSSSPLKEYWLRPRSAQYWRGLDKPCNVFDLASGQFSPAKRAAMRLVSSPANWLSAMCAQMVLV